MSCPCAGPDSCRRLALEDQSIRLDEFHGATANEMLVWSPHSVETALIATIGLFTAWD